MKGYTTVANVESQLGRAMTDEQRLYCNDIVLPATESWIDSMTGGNYGEGAVTGELLLMTSAQVWLKKAPVVTLGEVRGYYWLQQPSEIAPLPTNYYRLMNPDTGQLFVPGWINYAHLEADYVPDDTIPGTVTLAASMVAGVFMRTVLHPASEWLTDYGSAQDVRLKFRDLAMPEMVMTLLGLPTDGSSTAAGGGQVVVA
jgi:hypothetical protein